MSCENTEYWRIISKYSTISGATPSIPPSQDHTDGTWSPTDLYVGEFFVNVADDLVWVRTINGIMPISSATGGSGSYIGDYVSKSLGGTYSGGVYAPTMSSITFTGTNFIGDNFTGGNFTGTFSGDGSGLTGITAVWTGGTVSNPVYFTNTLDLTNNLTIDGSISTNNSYIDIQDELWVNGGVSASYFVGDGSLLTNIPIGATSNDYTVDAYLDGSTLKFDRTDLVDAYSVDLSPIMSTNSITGVNFDGTNYTIYLTDGTEWSVDMTTFNSLSVTGAITADEFNGGTFNGTFIGTYSNDIYTTGVVLVGNEEIFTRTDGSTYSVDLSSLVVSGATPSLSDVLSVSELAGNHNIYFPNGWGVRSSGGITSSTGLGFDNDAIFLHAGTGSVDDYSSRATIAATKNGSAVIQVENDVEFNMNLGGLGAGLFTIYGYVGFNGAEYGADYSTNYTNRSLVDKEYVDNAVSGAGGTLEETLALGNNSGTYSILMASGSSIEFDNLSQLRKGTYDFGGQGGISQICSVNYENNWQSGINHIFDNSGFIRESLHCFNIIPDNTFDSSLRFQVGSRWILDNGDIYICSDATIGSAVWTLDTSDPFVYITENTGAGTLTMSTPTSITSTVTDGTIINEDYNGLDYSKKSYDDGLFTSELLLDPLGNWNMTMMGEKYTGGGTQGYVNFSQGGQAIDITTTDGVVVTLGTQYDLTNSTIVTRLNDGLYTSEVMLDPRGNIDITKIGERYTGGGTQGYIKFGQGGSEIYSQVIDNVSNSLYTNLSLSTMTLTNQVSDGTDTSYTDIQPGSINHYAKTSGLFRVDPGSGNLSEMNLSSSNAYLLNTAGEGRNTHLNAEYDYAEMKQDEGLSVIRSQVSLDNGFYQSQLGSTDISKGVSKTNFVSLQTTNGATTSAVWPLSGLEIGTTAVGIKATVTGMKSDDTKAYVAELYAAVRMNAYAVTIFGGVDKLEKSEFTTATSTIEIESSAVAIRVIGEASTTIRWSVKYELIYSV